MSFSDLFYDYGLESCRQLRQMGFDALDLVCHDSCRDLMRMFSIPDIYIHFIECAGDAVCLAATRSGEMLGLTIERALKLCTGKPVEAAAVLEAFFQQYLIREDADGGGATIRRASPIASVRVSTLLATNIDTIGGLPSVKHWHSTWWHDVQSEFGSPAIRTLGGPVFTIKG